MTNDIGLEQADQDNAGDRSTGKEGKTNLNVNVLFSFFFFFLNTISRYNQVFKYVILLEFKKMFN